MPSSPQDSSRTNGKTMKSKHRTGCYTCRVRKVRCERQETDQTTGGPSTTQKCENCSRLNFDCRWTAPQPGEHYDPPPKRRRTLSVADKSHANDMNNDVTITDDPFGGLSNGWLVGSTSSSEEISASLPANPEVPAINMFDFLDFGDSFASTPMNNDHLLPIPPIPFPSNNLTNDAWDPGTVYQQSSHNGYSDARNQQTLAADNGMDLLASFTDSDNRLLIQHYLEVMKGYAKIQDRPAEHSNPYILAFSRALSTPPLFNAILAYSAAHLSLTQPHFHSISENHAQKALNEIQQSIQRNDGGASNTSLLNVGTDEALLWALFILIKTEQMVASPISKVLLLLDTANQIVKSPRGSACLQGSEVRRHTGESTNGSGNGSAGGNESARGIVIRLGFVDCRASVFQMGGGDLTRELQNHPATRYAFDVDQESGPDEGDLALLRADLLLLKVGELDQRIQQQKADTISSPVQALASPQRQQELVWPSTVSSLHEKIRMVLKKAERTETLRPGDVLEHKTYNRYLQCCALHSSLLYLYMIWPMPQMQPQVSISAIFNYQLLAARDPTRMNNPTSIWPSSIVFAGCLSDDLIYRDWCITELRRGEKWGKNVTRMREVCEAVWKERDRRKAQGEGVNGTEVDVGEIVRGMGGFLL